MTRRTNRVNVLLRQEISNVISGELRDPRISGLVTVTGVYASDDLQYARVYVSVMGPKNDKDTVIEGLNRATGFIRRQLKHRITLRYVPGLKFMIDDSMEKAEDISRIIDKLSFQDMG